MNEEVDPWADRVLATNRPAPDPRWERDLERALIARVRRRPLHRRPAALAIGFGSALTTAVIAAGLIGGGPLSISGNDAVQAEPDCRWVEIRRIKDIPRIVVDEGGNARVVIKRQRVKRQVQRCR